MATEVEKNSERLEEAKKKVAILQFIAVENFLLTRIGSPLQLLVAFFAACTTISVAFLLLDFSQGHWRPDGHDCSDPSTRKEWRYLGASEKHAYIDAIQCLSRRPSLFDGSSSRYDDFALAHVSEGLHIHYAAAFLPWHRHFIDTFERTLKKDCQYNGSLIYWDWSLDAEDLTQSPMWDVAAFGSEGLGASEEAVGNGRCVIDGPFANSTRYWQATLHGGSVDISRNPHCLSRGFETRPKKEELQERVSPAAVESILGQQAYADFFEELENHVHNAIPQFIKGDFLLQTAPNGIGLFI
ncbi:hypothetical protein LLEC1_06351 [Akanthomyces lecanii]|uniref:Tyrosinase copper-binding domain-containing protein n=1 Tax=Cordyceps confragosa TaxID=2714763 RepID=A0A179I1K9_CORDF|nr:hypothetical protein LLEC1_06351 [Akanthomyces lecanii]